MSILTDKGRKRILDALDEADEDLISRTDLLNAIFQQVEGKDYDGVNMLNIPHIDIIENMPSYNSIKIELNGDLISRQAVIDGLARIAKAKAKSDAQKALMGRSMYFVENLPSVEKTAEWIVKTDNEGTYGVCSNCGKEQSVGFLNYCPYCGYRMVVDK